VRVCVCLCVWMRPYVCVCVCWCWWVLELHSATSDPSQSRHVCPLLRLTAADGARFNLLHHLLKPILPCSAPAVLAPALTNLFENFEEVLTYENDNEYGNTFSSEIWNMKAGGDEKLPICYLVLCAPHDMRERMVMLALQKGALFPVNSGEIKRYELEQVRLMGMITDAMKTSADKSWAIVKYAIIHADYELIRRVVTARLPIYMINPSSTASFFPYVAPLHLVVDLRYYVMSRTYAYMHAVIVVNRLCLVLQGSRRPARRSSERVNRLVGPQSPHAGPLQQRLHGAGEGSEGGPRVLDPPGCTAGG